ncbi:DNA-binding response regulator, OmpR family, contains REC and winged-helix (wHTH) domain [Azospirillum oryzae]|uniref:DNA-binding response regulator, OmpR family, contains REC and winged-helix (WHTH) domain n=1 Tax=Azospirillum oryzae TaxID=286727 RepID=A0A1X7FDC2_9PROT|nr:response regulator transcription factor [Azospirillum oryzae]SMF49881.1 DNA-binding response regulator, OmpR family, contains REC and winged-helix (wHTH) domain [Azospirillum oryzae]
MARIIVVEDEADLRDDLVEYLDRCGFEVRGASRGAELDRLLEAGPADVIVLDINLPDEDGFSVARRVRAGSPAAIIMLTARSSLIDRVIGLELGADVYLVKPVDFREVEAQIKALMRRMQKGAESPPAAEQVQPSPAAPAGAPGADLRKAWLFDDIEWRIQPPTGAAVPLTATEYKFLSLLVTAPGEAVSRQDISLALTGRDWDPYSRSIDSLVRRLRIKVEERSGCALPVQAVHGVGYAFIGPVVSSAVEDSAG